MKKINFIFLLSIIILAGCGKEEGLSDNSSEKQAETLKKELCFGGKFVERELKEMIAHNQNIKAVVKQKDYVFNPDGKGTLTTYTINQTFEGYKSTEEPFTWSISDTAPFSLKIRVGQMGTFSLDEAVVNDEFLSFKNGDWNKELIASKNLAEDDIVSYSVEYLHGWTERRNLEMYVFITPSILTVNTKEGKMRFIRNRYGYNSIGFPYGTFEKKGNEYVLIPSDYKANIYFQVNPTSPIFYDKTVNPNEMEFKTIENGSTKYNFHIGHINQDHSLSFIDNNKDHQID